MCNYHIGNKLFYKVIQCFTLKQITNIHEEIKWKYSSINQEVKWIYLDFCNNVSLSFEIRYTLNDNIRNRLTSCFVGAFQVRKEGKKTNEKKMERMNNKHLWCQAKLKLLVFVKCAHWRRDQNEYKLNNQWNESIEHDIRQLIVSY